MWAHSMAQLHCAAGRSLQQRPASERGLATEYHLAGPGVPHGTGCEGAARVLRALADELDSLTAV
jgi:hypothetical protein